MRIGGPQRPASASAGASARRAGGSGFTLDAGQASRPGEARAAGAAAAVGGLDALLALQMVGDPLEGRRRGVKRGRAMLDALDELKIALLAGRLPTRDLARLVASVEGRERDSEDARLEGLLDEIELRARVELAKLERASRA